nr:hypothetical protein [Tanacetum cinerariifolium]
MLIYHEMNEKGFKPNCVTYNRMIQSCFLAERFEDAHKLLDDVLAQGQTLYTNTYCDILHDLLEKELLVEALSLYDDVKVLLYKMKRQKHCLNKSTLSTLRASVATGSLDVTLSNLIKKLV